MRNDVIVVGTGGMGAAACYEVARRGHRVLGLDRHYPPHDLGSTHGRSRIIRQAYMEAPEYVPLLQAAYPAWRALEEASTRDLLTITGGMMIGPPGSAAVSGSLRSAREHGLDHELLDADEIARRYPPFRPEEGMAALFEAAAGVLDPEECVAAFLELAERHGAELRGGVRVVGWSAGASGIEVRTEAGDRFEAETLVLAPGPWAPDLLGGLEIELHATREVMHWFAPATGVDRFLPDRFPIWLWEPSSGDVVYGFPALDGPEGGVKVAIHHGGPRTTPESVGRAVEDADVRRIRASLEKRLPELAGEHLHGAVCMYTNSSDHHFLLGPHPDHARVCVAAGLSGHGFKFASVIGPILADLALEGSTEHPIGPFRLDRPAA